MTQSVLGQSLTRLEDRRFITGKATYIDDMNLDNQAYGAFFRSPHAHAEIKAIDTGAAENLPGVMGVYTASDLEADQIGDLPCTAVAVVATDKPIIVPPRCALARGRVRHAGEPVVFVVAASADIALAALDVIDVEFEELPAVADGREALTPGAAEIWPQASGNLCFHFEKGDRAAVDDVFAKADHVISLEVVNNRVSAAPIEPRGAIGSYDAATDTLTLQLAGQSVHGIRRQLANAVFKKPEAQVRVVAPDVGGGFGLKNFVYPEWVMLLWSARHLGQPVKWIAERNEEFMSSTQGRDVHATVRLALDKDGRFQALRTDMVANMGAYLSTFGPGVSTNAASSAMGGIYAIPSVYMSVQGVFTNTLPIDAYRGAGKPEANYMIERAVEAAAVRIGMDPVQLRLQNVITEFPYRSALGIEIDTGNFKNNIERTSELADREGFEKRREAASAAGRLRGLGLACYLETARGMNVEGAEIRFATDGGIELRVGTESNGQGHETAYCQIASARFGLPIEVFRYIQADTREIRLGHGHGGARSMHMGGGAMVAAIDAVLDKARPVAAELLQADEAEIEYSDGVFYAGDGRAGGQSSVPLIEVAAAARASGLPDTGADAEGYPQNGLDSFAKQVDAPFTFPSGCHAAEVEIDRETGALRLERYIVVDDYGSQINPRLVAGQVHGGLAQGLGQAMMEKITYDPDTAQLLSGSLMDYALPRAAALPPFEIHFEHTPTAANPLGVKGAGQAGSIAAPPTLVAAVLDALKPMGITDIDMPVTAESLWRIMREND